MSRFVMAPVLTRAWLSTERSNAISSAGVTYREWPSSERCTKRSTVRSACSVGARSVRESRRPRACRHRSWKCCNSGSCAGFTPLRSCHLVRSSTTALKYPDAHERAISELSARFATAAILLVSVVSSVSRHDTAAVDDETNCPDSRASSVTPELTSSQCAATMFRQSRTLSRPSRSLTAMSGPRASRLPSTIVPSSEIRASETHTKSLSEADLKLVSFSFVAARATPSTAARCDAVVVEASLRSASTSCAS
mmetsp:Transcript_27983/g.86732  ORF Transcript_27983/g.86732 Transcript_27983/m.86732 type:complete len:252 (+) Transcript_27983:1168-1923(+)